MESVQLVQARNGQPTLTLRRQDGRRLFLHSSYDPEREASGWASQVEPKENDLIILYGLGLGYHLAALMRRLGADRPYVVVEPHPEVLRLALEGPARQFLREPNVVIAREWGEIRRVLDGKRLRFFFTQIPVYRDLYPRHYQEIARKLRAELTTTLVDQHTVLKFTTSWQVNFLKNLPYLAESAPSSFFFQCMSNKPAIVVAAGPSLNESIPLLRQVQERALILAVGTVARLLQGEGIRPHALVSFDGGKYNYIHHFQGLEWPDVPLVWDPAIHPRIVAEYQGPKVIMLVQQIFGWLEEQCGHPLGRLVVGPSVANSTFDLAVRSGANPILLVGQDLAYPHNQIHARGTHRDGYDGYSYTFQGDEDLIPVPGNSGRPVGTTPRMLSFLHWFEEYLDGLPDRLVINTSPSGASIRGTTFMPLEQALRKYCNRDLSQELSDLRERLGRPPAYDLDGLISYLSSAEKSFRNMLGECRRASRLCKQLLLHYEKKKPLDAGRVLHKLDTIDRRLKSSPLNVLGYVIHPILALVKNVPIERQGQEADITRQSLLMYSQFEKAFQFCLPLLRECIAELRQRSRKGIPVRVRAGGSRSRQVGIRSRPLSR